MTRNHIDAKPQSHEMSSFMYQKCSKISKYQTNLFITQNRNLHQPKIFTSILLICCHGTVSCHENPSCLVIPSCQIRIRSFEASPLWSCVCRWCCYLVPEPEVATRMGPSHERGWKLWKQTNPHTDDTTPVLVVNFGLNVLDLKIHRYIYT